MQKSYYIYEKPGCNIVINKMPIWFKEIESEFIGDNNKGSLKFETFDNYDENWGPIATISLSWDKKERFKFFHAKEVQQDIEMFNAINVVVIKKERGWLNSHEFTTFYGKRTKMVRKKYYSENFIHGMLYCDMTERIFNFTSEIIRNHYEGYKPYILEAFNSFNCH